MTEKKQQDAPPVPIGEPPKKRGLSGLMKRKWPELPDSPFFDPLPEDELRLWEGRDDDKLG